MANTVKYKTGDRVVVATREQTASDIKSGLYYSHFAGLRGSILKLYGEEASVLVDTDTLPDEVGTRHKEGEKAMRQRWLDGLSEEAKNRMSAREKEFHLNYSVLVSLSDISPDKSKPKSESEAADDEAKRLSANDLDAAEEAHLAELRKSNGSS
jgi:hypothetical protein